MLKKLRNGLTSLILISSLAGCESSASFSGLKSRNERLSYINNCVNIAEEALEKDSFETSVVSCSNNSAHIYGIKKSDFRGEGYTSSFEEKTNVNIQVGKGLDKYSINSTSIDSFSGITKNFAGFRTTISRDIYSEEIFLDRIEKSYEHRSDD